LLALIFGMFSGGIAYNRKLVLTNAVREGSRYGATLPVAAAPALTPACTDQIDCWLAQVATVTKQAAEGELGNSVAGWKVCVAYVYPDGTDTNDKTRSRLLTPSGLGAPTPAGTCFPSSDGRPTGERRVQVTAERPDKLQYLVSTTNLTLFSQAVTRFEAAP